MLPLGMQEQQYPESMDVTISVGFVRGIIMKEQAKRRKDWNTNSELDSVKAVVTAMVPATGFQAEGFLTSGPLENPKKIGEELKYNAIFPLKERDSNGAATRIVMPGLLQRDRSNTDDGQFPSGQYKRQTIELLITLVFGNEAFTLGKATMLVTGEEVKTKQSDLPIDTAKSSVIKLQKLSTFPMKRSGSMSSNKHGEIAPTSFKYDRRRRKYQIEKDAVLRAYMKVTPSNPYAGQAQGQGQGQDQGRAHAQVPGGRDQSGIPRNITPNMGFEPPMSGNPSMGFPQQGGFVGSHGRVPSSPSVGSYRGHPSPMGEFRDHSRVTLQTGGYRSHSSSPRSQQQSVQGNGSLYGGSQQRSQQHVTSQGRAPPPGAISMTRTRSQSTPRQPAGFGSQGGGAYGGSSFNGSNGAGPGGYGFSGSGSARGRTSSRQEHYGGSSYGGSQQGSSQRKPQANQGSQYGGSTFHRTGTSQQQQSMRSASPHVYNR